MLLLFQAMKDTLILFGRSLFIDKIKKHIPDLISKYDTMGINTFYKSFPDVKFVIFYDKIAAPKEKINNLIVTDIKNKDAVCHQDNVQLYKVITNREEFSTKKDEINFYYFTSSMAINWAYINGYKNIVLAGIDLINNLHFDDKNHKPIIADGVLDKTKIYMEDICQKHINIFQLNPESDLKVLKITLQELLKGE